VFALALDQPIKNPYVMLESLQISTRARPIMKKHLTSVLASLFLGMGLAILTSVLGSASTTPLSSDLALAAAASDPGVPALLVPQTNAQAVITVPYRYQGESDGRLTEQKQMDCGQASVAMAIQYATEQTVSVKTIHDFIGKDGLTGADDLARALDHWSIDYGTVANAAGISAALADGHPLIAVIQAGEISEAKDDYCATAPTDPSQHFDRFYDYTDGHWLVVKGVSSDGNWVVVNDPNVWGSHPSNKYWYSDGTPKGASRYYSSTEFTVAFDAKGEDALEIKTLPYISRLDARVINQPPVLVLSPGQTSRIHFDVQNTSVVTLWSGRTTLSLLVDQSNRALITSPTHQLDSDIPPGYQVRWEIEIAAPDAPGFYSLHWQMHFADAPFGPVLSCRVRVGGLSTATWLPTADDEGIDPSGLVDAWLRSLLAETTARIESHVGALEEQILARLEDLQRQFEVSLVEGLVRLLAIAWETAIHQCYGAIALAPLSLLVMLHALRRRL